MKHLNVDVPFGLDAPILEILLADIAIRVELSPGKHQLAVNRYKAVADYLERDDSSLRGLIVLFYPQGSMPIGATIESWRRDNGHDIDIVAELRLPRSMSPAAVLDSLFRSINGFPGSRYYGMVERQTRCVTVHYSDGMHLDITPSTYDQLKLERESIIFHAKPEQPPSAHSRHIINSYAFVRWVQERTPIDLEPAFAKAYWERALAYERKIRAAHQEEVPEHSTEAGGKSVAIVALQLMKRNRNVRYQALRRTGRIPPSVMLSKLAAEVATPGHSITEGLIHLAKHVRDILQKSQRRGQLLDVRNPCCSKDKFTDRWPEDLTVQRTYLDDVEEFCTQLAELAEGTLSLNEMRESLTLMFGEEPTASTVHDYMANMGSEISQGRRQVGKRGGIILTGTAATSSTPAHTFYDGIYKACGDEPFDSK